MLHCAQTAEQVNILLDAGADIESKSMFGETRLFRGPFEVIQTLVNRGANVNARDSLYGSSVLSLWKKNPFMWPDTSRVVEFLEAHGATE
jgi:hypothetical protein